MYSAQCGMDYVNSNGDDNDDDNDGDYGSGRTGGVIAVYTELEGLEWDTSLDQFFPDLIPSIENEAYRCDGLQDVDHHGTKCLFVCLSGY